MQVDVIMLPRDLRAADLCNRCVVVFDVLRATTSMTAALAAQVREIRIFADINAAATARKFFPELSILCGEVNAVAPTGFDLGNSPGSFNFQDHAKHTVFIGTTNGTRAIIAAQTAPVVFIGALVNAKAVARAVVESEFDVTLLCAGTNGEIAMEDLLGCGAVFDALSRITTVSFASDRALIAHELFSHSRNDLVAALRATRGGMNVVRVGLSADIEFCGRLDSLDVVGRVFGDPPIIRKV